MQHMEAQERVIEEHEENRTRCCTESTYRNSNPGPEKLTWKKVTDESNKMNHIFPLF